MAMHRGLTAEQRREQRRRQLIEAALDTIAEHGVSNLRVRAVSTRARLNDRYFYESFADCHELLLATFDDQFGRVLTGIMATLADSPRDLRLRVRAIIVFALEFIDDDPRRSRLLVELQTAEALAGRRHDMISVLTQLMVAQVRELLGHEAGAEGTIMLTALTVVSGLLEVAAQWYRHQIDVGRSEFIDFTTALVVTTTDIPGALARRLEPPEGAEL
ncbi:TetR/AcrR family transcriptional regulator [Mycobacterium sp. Marseille-P9652]|uniref:TetR/AcrR family transcriptional regulator n=1 Tax=Mycobacterium sp. Marseille-P9652 TaxID=2654950 RepID=UPI0012E96B4F|nr:TetR/AcrR family transcriptional regulator [Mycobacterium sp. Marseille-P9652]